MKLVLSAFHDMRPYPFSYSSLDKAIHDVEVASNSLISCHFPGLLSPFDLQKHYNHLSYSYVELPENYIKLYAYLCVKFVEQFIELDNLEDEQDYPTPPSVAVYTRPRIITLDDWFYKNCIGDKPPEKLDSLFTIAS
jgi:hypothetical protein